MISSHKTLFPNQSQELGTGTGLCAMTAALGGATRVFATDYEDIPLRLLEFAALNINSNLREDNRLSVIETCE